MKKVLIVVDYQYDFVAQDGALPVPGADKIADNIQSKINSNNYDKIIYTFDTHTKEQYNNSEEKNIFPNIHCEFGTKGWNFFKIKPKNNIEFQYMVNNLNQPFKVYDINNEYFFTKDVFNIWDGNDIYPEWFKSTFNKNEYEFDVVGVATNYCVFMNIMGMVSQGYKVNIIENAVEGIKKFPNGEKDESFKRNINIMKDRGVNFEKGN